MNEETQVESPPEADTDVMTRVVEDEEQCLDRVRHHLEHKKQAKPSQPPTRYDEELVSLRDQIASARLEDVPPLVEQMSRLQSLAARQRERTTGYIDPNSPYFGRLVLEEGERRREVLIGRSTYLDTEAGVRIVDWREAPVSRLYYRYNEGDDYIETFGEREVEGEVRTRRSLAIVDGKLRRITSPEGTFVRTRQGSWKPAGAGGTLRGGQGTAARAEQLHKPGKLGVGADETGEDKHLKEITALIDKRQFELITRPDSGLVVIQGGAGSGKTTIGLHRLAYLAYQDKRRFRTDKMIVIVFNSALARYVSYVLPALGVSGVSVRTYNDWATKLRQSHLARAPKKYTEDTPLVVTRFKKHPAMLKLIDQRIAMMAGAIETSLREALGSEADSETGQKLLDKWAKSTRDPLVHRVFGVQRLAEKAGSALSGPVKTRVQSVTRRAQKTSTDVIAAWADALSGLDQIKEVYGEHASEDFTAQELERAHAWCTAKALKVLDEIEEQATDDSTGRDIEAADGGDLGDAAVLDYEDDTLFLRFIQRLRGPLFRGKGKKDPLVYEHVLIDEAQDLSPVELAVIMDTVSRAESVTMAGDVAQRLNMDNGFTNWKRVMGDLGRQHVEIEPLEISYRSTHEIIEFSTEVLGHLANKTIPKATRSGAPVELMRFSHTGDAVGFLAESLRDLLKDEPLASVAVIARYPEQADVYYSGLVKAEVPYVRRVGDQDFPFKPGIDVTDVRQVKGLEFDYVVLVEVSNASYPKEDEPRHLLHIAATRAAHQLWVTTTGTASELLPEKLLAQGY